MEATQAAIPKTSSAIGRNIGILLAFVEDFSIENIRIRDSHGWAISLERCARGRVRDIDFASGGSKTIDGSPRTILNQDGLTSAPGLP